MSYAIDASDGAASLGVEKNKSCHAHMHVHACFQRTLDTGSVSLHCPEMVSTVH